MSIYKQLEKLVLPVVKNWTTDLTDHDKRQLEMEENKGLPFIYAYRRTGTCMFFLCKTVEDTYKESWLQTLELDRTEDAILKEMVSNLLWIDGPLGNTHFLYFDGKKLRTSTAAELTQIYKQHARSIISKYMASRKNIAA